MPVLPQYLEGRLDNCIRMPFLLGALPNLLRSLHQHSPNHFRHRRLHTVSEVVALISVAAELHAAGVLMLIPNLIDLVVMDVFGSFEILVFRFLLV